jgi:hypothetical protein
VVEYAPGEVAPLGYQRDTGMYFQPVPYEHARPGHTYVTRTLLAEDTQIKIWLGLIDRAVVEHLLATDPVVSSAPSYGTVFSARKLTLACGLVGLFKPASSDDDWTGNHWAEIATYQVDRAIGANYVPTTVLRQEPTRGSFQLWVDGLVPMSADQLPPDLRFLDKLTANSDRGNEMSPNFKAHPKAPNGVVAFDNGCTFLATVTGLEDEIAETTPQRTPVLEGFAALTPDLIEALPEQPRIAFAARIQQLRELLGIPYGGSRSGAVGPGTGQPSRQ